MEMKKVACATLVATTSMSAALAAGSPAPAPTSDATATLPVVGSLIGASIVSSFAFYMH
ncbi:arabinogalactan protein 23-like [Camellia sinensis]|uniref:arabinogalactan protein 23-like n=1 Tax=Camellia sinensis TaxID=4442 RepID=UPI001035707F|nr:arabinogalactan protein 23-like [Camellia sinensis]